jgi:hypothetical protein
VTLFAVWQGVFAVWAWRRAAAAAAGEAGDGTTDDVLVVGPYARRDEACFQRTVGYLLNMLVYKYEVGGKGMGGWSLEAVAAESGRVVGEAMERGGWYPFSRLMREAGVRGAEGLMDVTFNWMTGQGLGPGGRQVMARALAKNAFSVHCADGRQLVAEAATGTYGMQELEGVLAELLQAGTSVGGIERSASQASHSIGRQLQEEEWGTGETLSTMAVTFQGVVRQCLRRRKGAWAGRLVDVGRTVGGAVGSVMGLNMERSERLVWLVYSTVWGGRAFLPLDAQYPGAVVAYRLRDAEAEAVVVDRWKKQKREEGAAEPPRLVVAGRWRRGAGWAVSGRHGATAGRWPDARIWATCSTRRDRRGVRRAS